jgi:transposase
MIAITPQMRVLVAIEPADFRCGIDGLSHRCRSVLKHNPFVGTVIVFRNRAGKAIKLLVYDGQGFWLCYKRMSSSRFRFWPSSVDGVTRTLLAHELHVLIFGGDPLRAQGAPVWREVAPQIGPVGNDPGAYVP